MNVTISREGLESLQNGGKARTYEGVVKQKESIMQASKSLGAGYGYRLSEEAGKLKGQRESGGAWSVSVVPAVNGASCVHLPFALARAGKFYPSITYYARKGKTGNVFEKILKNLAMFFKKILKKIFKKHKNARLRSVFSRVCIGFFFSWVGCGFSRRGVCDYGRENSFCGLSLSSKNVTGSISRFYQFCITIALRLSAK